MSFSYWGADAFAPAQFLTLSGDYIGLIPGGNAVNVGSTTTVALTANKTSAISYNGGLLETNVDGSLNIDSGSVLGSQRFLGALTEVTTPAAGAYTVNVNGSNALQVSNTHMHLTAPEVTVNGSAPTNAILKVNGDLTLKGTNPSVNFQDATGTEKAFLDYVSDKITLSCRDVVAEAVGASRGHRVILDAFGAALTSTDAPVTLQRSQTGVGIRTIASFQDNGVVQIGAAGITTFPTIKLQSGTDPVENLTVSYDSVNDKANILTGTNGQLQIQTGSSMGINSGGTLSITASDSVTIAANDSTVLMTSDVIVTALGNTSITGGTNVDLIATAGQINLSAPNISIGTTSPLGITLPTLTYATTPTIMYYDTATAKISYGANALPCGIVRANSMGWANIPGTSYFTAAIGSPGVVPSAIVNATLQLYRGYNTIPDIDTCFTSYIIAACAVSDPYGVDTIEFIAAGDLNIAGGDVLLNWAIVG